MSNKTKIKDIKPKNNEETKHLDDSQQFAKHIYYKGVA